MPLIDKTYFIGEITIAQLGQAKAVQDSLALFIGKRETEYLQKALGYAFWKLFIAGIADDRFIELKNGAEYNNCKDYLKKWTGLVNAEKQSPIANYVYFWYMRDNVTYTSPVGEVEGKTENASSSNNVVKTTRAWNEMVDQTKALHDFLLNKKDGDGALVYPEFDIKQADCLGRINVMNL